MKKVISVLSVLLVGILLLSLAACGGSADTEAGPADSTPASSQEVSDSGEDVSDSGEKVYQIGIIQQMQHPALDAATQGFEDAIIEALGEDAVLFDLQNGQGDEATLATIANTFVSNDVDLIMANATTALQSAAAATDTIPILGTSITDYATALSIEDWNGTVGNNISGATDLAPLDQQAQMLADLFPVAQYPTVGLLYCSAEPNSVYQIETVKGYLEEKGYTCSSFSFSDSNDLATVAQSAVDGSDVIYIPTDNTVASYTGIVDNVAVPAKVPIVAGEEGICSGCGVVTLTIDYYDMGHVAGEQAVKILTGEADVSTMPIESVKEFTKKYVPDRLAAIGLELQGIDDYEAIEMTTGE